MERLFESSPSDRLLRTALLEELRHRSTASARQLEQRVTGHTAVAMPQKPMTPAAVEPPPPAATNSELERASLLAMLRATFTLEAELLARWGMTPAMPEDLREAVFRLWANRLGTAEDRFGRSDAALARDRRRLDEERRFLDQRP
jgi:hypothetical protein